MTTVAGAAPSAPRRAADRDFFLLMLGLVWLGVLMGFGGDILEHLRAHKASYLPIVHVHAAVFVGWLALLSTQILLIRSGDVARHRKLGALGAVLAVVMVPLGLATGLMVDAARVAHGGHASFFAVQAQGIIAFAMLAGAAFALRRDPPAHKRLMLMATIYLADAGWSRWLGGPVSGLVGGGVLGRGLGLYVFSNLLVAMILGYDLLSKRGLKRPVIAGAAAGLGLQALAVYLLFAPAWQALMDGLLRR